MFNIVATKLKCVQFNELKYIKNQYNKRLSEQILTIRLKMLSLTKELITKQEKKQSKSEISKSQRISTIKNQVSKGKKDQNNKIQTVPLETQDKNVQRDETLMQLLKNMNQKAKLLKSQIKQSKDLPLEDIFVIEKSHVCTFCGKIFERPCALGGHTSKLHSK